MFRAEARLPPKMKPWLPNGHWEAWGVQHVATSEPKCIDNLLLLAPKTRRHISRRSSMPGVSPNSKPGTNLSELNQTNVFRRLLPRNPDTPGLPCSRQDFQRHGLRRLALISTASSHLRDGLKGFKGFRALGVSGFQGWRFVRWAFGHRLRRVRRRAAGWVGISS